MKKTQLPKGNRRKRRQERAAAGQRLRDALTRSQQLCVLAERVGNFGAQKEKARLRKEE